MAQQSERPQPAARRKTLAGFIADRRGNLLPLFAIVLPLMLFSLGAAVDYTSAARRQEAIDGIADAAALAGTQPIMMTESCATGSNTTPSTVTNPPIPPASVSGTGATNQTACNVALQQVVNVFDAQLNALYNSGVSGASSVALTSVSILDNTTTNVRTVSVVWSAKSGNIFSGILGMPYIAIGDTSVAKNSPAPVTTVYMLIDNSPSMQFPGQNSGITTLGGATLNDSLGNCALGCHQYDSQAYSATGLYNPANVECAVAATTHNGTYSSGQAPNFACVSTETTSTTSTVTNTGFGASCNGLTGCTCTGSGSGKSCTGTQTTNTTTNNTIAPLVGTSGTTTAVNNSTGVTTITQPVNANTTNTYVCNTVPTGQPNGGVQSTSVSYYWPSGVTPPTKNVNYGAEDNFALARCLGVQLRIDLVNAAVQSLFQTAPGIAASNNTSYAVQVYSLDFGNNNTPDIYSQAYPNATALTQAAVGLYPIYYWGCPSSTPTCGTQYTPAQIEAQPISTTSDQDPTGFFAAATTAAGTLAPLETYTEGQTTNGVTLSSGVTVGGVNYWLGNSGENGDNDTYFDAYGLGGMFAVMPWPGIGTGSGANAVPKEILFIVSDGENDVASVDPNGAGLSESASCQGTTPSGTAYGMAGKFTYYGRPQICAGQLAKSITVTNPYTGVQSTYPDYCAAFQGEGIEVAFLYLRYNALNPSPWVSQGNPGGGSYPAGQSYFQSIEPWQYPGSVGSGYAANAGNETNCLSNTNASCLGTYTDAIEQSAINCASPGLEFTVDSDTNITAAMAALFVKATQTAYLAH